MICILFIGSLHFIATLIIGFKDRGFFFFSSFFFFFFSPFSLPSHFSPPSNFPLAVILPPSPTRAHPFTCTKPDLMVAKKKCGRQPVPHFPNTLKILSFALVLFSCCLDIPVCHISTLIPGTLSFETKCASWRTNQYHRGH